MAHALRRHDRCSEASAIADSFDSHLHALVPSQYTSWMIARDAPRYRACLYSTCGSVSFMCTSLVTCCKCDCCACNSRLCIDNARVQAGNVTDRAGRRLHHESLVRLALHRTARCNWFCCSVSEYRRSSVYRRTLTMPVLASAPGRCSRRASLVIALPVRSSENMISVHKGPVV